MNYLKVIKKVKKNKYSNYLNLKKDFFISYFQSRMKFITQDISKINFYPRNENFFINNTKSTNTFNYFLNIYFKYNYKKKISINDKKKLYIFYKKYESNLKLKKNYDYDFFKTSEIETKIYSYIILGFFLKQLNKINSLQKLNCLIKINDHILLNNKKIKDKNFLEIFIQNLKFELNLLKKFTKKKHYGLLNNFK